MSSPAPQRPALGRRGVELVLDDGQALCNRRADHRGARPSDRVHPDAPPLPRPVGFRVRHHAALRDPGHGDRRRRTSSPSTCRRSRSPAPRSMLVICNVFRNMPVGVRAGMASMAQIDKSLDEASTTLGARGVTTLRSDPAAAAQTRGSCRARLQLRARDDNRVGDHLPRLRRVRMGDYVHHQPRRQRRLRRGDRLLARC